MLLALAIGATFLVLDAANAILKSADGELDEVILDPEAEGYETFVAPTVSHLVMIENSEKNLISIGVISLFPNDEGGSVLVLPPELLLPEGETLQTIYNSSGSDALELSLSEYLTTGFRAASVLANDFWIMPSLSKNSLSIAIEDPLVVSENSKQVVVFDSGEINVPVEQIGDFLGWLNDGESPYNRWLRQQEFWRAWIQQFGAEFNSSNSPLPSSNALERVFSGLNRGSLIVVEPALVEVNSAAPVFMVDHLEIKNLILEMIPFPITPFEGVRAKVKLVDGVGGLDLVNGYIPPLVANGAQIMLLGNAETFGVTQTQILYHDEAFNGLTVDFSNILNGAEITYDPLTEAAVDVTVIIGKSSIGSN